MTVSALIDQLKRVDGDRIVIMQSDTEGNSYSLLSSMWIGAYLPETTWYGNAGLETLTEENRAMGYSEEDVITNGQSALILYPVN